MKRIVPLFFIVLLSACEEKKYQPLIDENVMVNVVADLQLAEEALKKSPQAQKDSLKILYKQQILQIHNIEEDLLEIELLNMKDHPDYFKDFFDKVVERLEVLENKKKAKGKPDNGIN